MLSNAVVQITPSSDWITRKDLAALLGISRQTAYKLEKNGQFRRFEHGSRLGGRHRRFSRTLVQNYVQQCMDAAMLQDN